MASVLLHVDWKNSSRLWIFFRKAKVQCKHRQLNLLWDNSVTRERQAEGRGPVLSWGEVSCPPLLANAGSGGSAWEITRKWAMGICFRYVVTPQNNEFASHSLMLNVKFKSNYEKKSPLPKMSLPNLFFFWLFMTEALRETHFLFSLPFAGMPLAQAISILQKHCRIIKNVQVLYSEQVSYVYVKQILTVPF